MTRRKPHLGLFAAFLVCLAFAGWSAATKKPPLKPININTANSDELQQVPGIGPATAEKILQMRKSYGAFKSIDDLLSIRGVGKKRLDKMRKYLTVGKAGAPNKPVDCPGCSKTNATHPKSPAAKNPAPVPDSDDSEQPPARLTLAKGMPTAIDVF